MKRIVFLSILLVQCLSLQAQSSTKVVENVVQTKHSIFAFTVEDIYGEKFTFSSLEGKRIMIVNTASECGLTPQYEELQELYNRYKEENFVIVAFPANNFGAQEPGNNETIMAFCSERYGISFPMMSKISVKGEDMHPLYTFLTSKELNGLADSEVQWNFQKYLIDEKGQLSLIVNPRESPLSHTVLNWIESH